MLNVQDNPILWTSCAFSGAGNITVRDGSKCVSFPKSSVLACSQLAMKPSMRLGVVLK